MKSELINESLHCFVILKSLHWLYFYFSQHTEREFVLKFSALEIYNESVRDLLSVDSTPLRLLDDPEVNIFISFFSKNWCFYILPNNLQFASQRKKKKTYSLQFKQKGTVVERLTEETLRDWSHFQELISFCEGRD